MQENVPGRIENVPLEPNQYLRPLFEAITNSFDSIASTPDRPGEITVTIERDHTQTELYEDHNTDPVINFQIDDNGIGFDDPNFNSFDTLDGRYKPGAKGIGRLLWLKAFDSVHIESIYTEKGSYHRRTFDFLPSTKGIENTALDDVKDGERRTSIRLLGFKKPFQKRCGRKDLTYFGDRVIEHFLISFLSESCPKVTIRDDSGSVVLNELFKDRVQGLTSTVDFKVKKLDFSLMNLRLYLSSDNPVMHFCARDRVVTSEPLLLHIPDLAAVKDEQSRPFSYAAYIKSSYLDSKVSQERTEFTLEKKSPLGFPEVVSYEDIVVATVKEIESCLAPLLQPIAERKLEQIRRFVESNPQYKPILKYKPEALNEIKPGLSDEKLDLALHKINSDIHAEVKHAYIQLLSRPEKEVTSLATYREQYRKLVENLNDVSKSELAQHIVHRKLILDLLQDALTINDDGTYPKEERIHQMVYPMNTTSEDVPYEQQNLWIVDEGLSYHDYLASHKQLRTYKNLETNSQLAPDLVIFGSRGSSTYDTVVIIEFKRAMLDDQSGEAKDPARQLCLYVDDIKQGRVTHENGRPIKADSSTRFFCFFLCDINDHIRAHMRFNGFQPSPDGLSFHGFKEAYNAYFHVIDYTKLIEDAKLRNRILFEKLGILHATPMVAAAKK